MTNWYASRLATTRLRECRMQEERSEGRSLTSGNRNGLWENLVFLRPVTLYPVHIPLKYLNGSIVRHIFLDTLKYRLKYQNHSFRCPFPFFNMYKKYHFACLFCTRNGCYIIMFCSAQGTRFQVSWWSSQFVGSYVRKQEPGWKIAWFSLQCGHPV